jgi:serine/threonine protein kinase
VAVKILENVADNIEEIEEEFLVLRDLSLHPNIPTFHGLYLRRGQTQEEDQLWFTMEVSIFLLSPGHFNQSNFIVLNNITCSSVPHATSSVNYSSCLLCVDLCTVQQP